ncbi:hypothetical protein [Helcococcus kunzii]
MKNVDVGRNEVVEGNDNVQETRYVLGNKAAEEPNNIEGMKRVRW